MGEEIHGEAELFGTIITDDETTGSPNDDTLIGNGGNDTISGWNGDDTIVCYGTGGILSGDLGNDYIEAGKNGYGQYHIYGGGGNDTIVMVLKNQSGWGHQGFHIYGNEGSDEFRFVYTREPDSPLLSRIDDFDPSRDTILVNDRKIDLNDPPEGMRIVLYLDQQWLVIGDNLMIGLDGARSNDEDHLDDGEEVHFSDFPTDLESLPTVMYKDPLNYVPFKFYELKYLSLSIFDGAPNRINGSADSDYVYSEKLDSIIYMGAGNDVVNAGKGFDSVYGDFGDDLLAGGHDEDLLFGGSGHDVLWGGSEDDSLYGGEGEDTIYGGGGEDTIYGDGGVNLVFGDEGDDLIYCSDSVESAGISDDVDTNSSEGNIINFEFNDFLSGNRGGSICFGGSGFDELSAGGGDDVLFGGSESDTLCGGSGDDMLAGEDGLDVLFGESGSDTLRGGGGNDTIDGGDGTDWLVGGAGADHFIFSSEFGMDTIFDFNWSEDGDVVVLSPDFEVAFFEQLVSDNCYQTGNDLIIDFGGGDAIRLVGFNVGDLSEGAFIF